MIPPLVFDVGEISSFTFLFIFPYFKFSMLLRVFCFMFLVFLERDPKFFAGHVFHSN